MLSKIFLEKINAQKLIDKFAKKNKNKKIVFYGAGLFAKELITKYNLLDLNIVGIVDKKFESNNPNTYFNFKTYTPDELNKIDYDILFISVLNANYVIKQLKNTTILKNSKNKKIYFLKNSFCKSVFELFPKKSDESCIICNNTKMHTYFATIAPFLVDLMFDFKEAKTELLHCPHCKFSYFKLRPNEEQISRYYDGYAQEKHAAHRAKYEPTLYEASFTKKTAEPNYRVNEVKNNIMRVSKEVKTFKKVLDFGGSASFFPSEFEHTTKYSYDIAFDENPDFPNYINDLSKLEKNSFDFIMSTHVLEHLSNPRGSVEEMTSLLKKGGYIYIELPDETGLINDVNRNVFRRLNDNRDFQMHEHLNIFKPESVKCLLESLGFEVIHSKYRKSDFFYGYRGYIWCLAKKK